MIEFVDPGEYRMLGEGEHLYWIYVALHESGGHNVWRVIAPTRDQAIFAVLRQYTASQYIEIETAEQDDGYICKYCGLVGGH